MTKKNIKINKSALSGKMEIKRKTIVFCLPGNNFSGKFLDCWTAFFVACFQNGIQPVLSRRESCNIYYVRNMCLGGDVSRGKDQKPFDGKLDYDYLMWIDSDQIYSFQQFKKLLDDNKDIVAGIYHMENSSAYAAVEKWDEEFFSSHGHFRPLVDSDLGNDLIEVCYSGMGFMLVKNGVFESLEYPWFRPIDKQIGNMVDFTMEDVGFCLNAKEKGFKIYIDPQVRVGHEKRMII